MNPDERPKFEKIHMYLKSQLSPGGEAENEELSDDTFKLENGNHTCLPFIQKFMNSFKTAFKIPSHIHSTHSLLR
jgi:hypothetical protein